MPLDILERLASGEVLIADGATGTMLQAGWLPTATPSEAWPPEQPQAMAE
jgi:methionine synthase I (cobalamin-dependent)